jgi:hypothetical protein
MVWQDQTCLALARRGERGERATTERLIVATMLSVGGRRSPCLMRHVEEAQDQPSVVLDLHK